MSAPPSASQFSLREFLLVADVPAEVLRRDRAGRTWLPEPLRQRAASCPAAREALRAFVELELELHDGAELRSDPLFTHRVMTALPPGPVALASWRRPAVLALFHSLGALMAWVTAWLLAPEELDAWVNQAHLWVDEGWLAAGPWTVAAAMVAAMAAALAILAPRPHTRAA